MKLASPVKFPLRGSTFQQGAAAQPTSSTTLANPPHPPVGCDALVAPAVMPNSEQPTPGEFVNPTAMGLFRSASLLDVSFMTVSSSRQDRLLRIRRQVVQNQHNQQRDAP